MGLDCVVPENPYARRTRSQAYREIRSQNDQISTPLGSEFRLSTISPTATHASSGRTRTALCESRSIEGYEIAAQKLQDCFDL